MVPFDEWVRTSKSPCIQRWKDCLLELGADWDSFQRDANEVMDDLVCGEIPRMAARDIYNVISEVVTRSRDPLAIFWDLEKMPIPYACSGRFVSARLTNILASHGHLTQFRGYASIGLGRIPQETRSDLQLSGCHLVDCPHHNGRNEVIDKMIIVDAMEFAFHHPEGAALCFITGDTDIAYLLSKLQHPVCLSKLQRPVWRTIVISQGALLESMLHVNCTVRLQWETDVLQLPTHSPSLAGLSPSKVASRDIESIASAENKPACNPMSYASSAAFFAPTTDTVTCGRINSSSESLKEAGGMSQKDIRSCPLGSKIGTGCLESQIGNMQGQDYPDRFPTRGAVMAFRTEAIDSGIVTETGERAFKTLSRPSSVPAGTRVPVVMTEWSKSPVSVYCLPEHIKSRATTSHPFILFIKRSHFPPRGHLPKGTFVQVYNKTWAILMYKSKAAVQLALTKCPQLSVGTLVDWTKVPISPPSPQTVVCEKCGSRHPTEDIFQHADGLFCESCFDAVWTDKEKSRAKRRVVDMLDMLQDNDDIYIAHSMLRKLLMQKHSAECASRKQAARWISMAEVECLVKKFNRDKMKNLISLTRNFAEANWPFPPDTVDTSAEEAHVRNLLCNSPGALLKRSTVVDSLKKNFISMRKTFMRNKVFLNGKAHKQFDVAKGPYGQMVALTYEDANEALVTLLPPWTVPSEDDSELNNVGEDSGVHEVRSVSTVSDDTVSYL